jgi:hypothetical protein
MKKIILAVIILVFLVGTIDLTLAAQKQREKKVTPPVQTVSLTERREAETTAKEVLSAKEWTIYLTPAGVKKAKSETDVLTFAEGKLTSKNLSTKGYPTSNITVTVQDNGTIIWETMQTKENGDMAFWRGELEGEAMRGVLSLQPVKGTTQDFSFNNVASGR